MRLASSFLLALILGACASASADRSAVPIDISKFFEEAGVTGTFVFISPNADSVIFHNEARARERYVPASTFKIPNSLIALETGAVADTSTVIAWDEEERWLDVWNQDHTMTTAFRHSVVWYYQEVARRIGIDQMRDFLDRFDYGDADVGGGIDRFWLTGELHISAMEQVDFLVRLYRDELPVEASTMADVRDIMIEEEGENYVLRAKTGWAQLDGHDIGWYVGYLESDERPYFFAMNMDMDGIEDAPLRKQITRDILAELGLM